MSKDKDKQPVHLHLVESFDAGWDGLNLIYEIEPRNEMAEMDFRQHFIIIACVLYSPRM